MRWRAICHFLHLLGAGLACCALAGCRLNWVAPTGRSPLKSFELAEGQSALEIYSIRSPRVSTAAAAEMWQGVDEFALSDETRRQLAANGLRAGVVTGTPNPVLAKLLAQQTQPLTSDELGEFVGDTANSTEAPGEPPQSPAELIDEIPLADNGGTLSAEKTEASPPTDAPTAAVAAMALGSEPCVRRNTLHLIPGQSAEVQAGGEHATWPLLYNNQGRIEGQSLTQARGVWRLQLQSAVNRGVRVRLLPEIQHGVARQHWVGEEGIIRQEIRKPRLTLEHLSISAQLLPGQMLVIAPVPDRPGSLGHYFLGHQVQGETEPKVLAIRLAQNKLDPLLQSTDE
ncbi:MAG: hypothetical protein SFX18_11385 [Pirellulales bacterium]|nr:hypothetical protein [Pirellulales bacterium]